MRFTYPVNLLLENKRCLIAGGGKVAARKLAALTGKAASITVVAPEICEKICELAATKNGIILREQEFSDTDLDGIFLAFAATSDKAVNRHISELCATRDVLCCIVDENWNAGSFITPASFSADGITVAVSTSGVSCRRTRLIKDNLAHHVGLAERAELLIVGTDYRFLGLKQREMLHLSPEKKSELGGMLKQLWGIHEFMLINTCNRLELAAIVCPSPGLERLLRMVMGFDSITEEQFYCKRSEAAFAHLAETAAGLFSQLTGEKHIAAQVKMALAEAKNNSWCGGLMQDWLDFALCLAKAIRGILEPRFGSMDIEEVTKAYLEDLFPDLPERRIVIAGTGTVGGNLVKLLAPRCLELVWLYHRRKPEIELALPGKIELFQLEHLEHKMTGADIVICAVAAEKPLLTGTPTVENIAKPQLIIDLGMPKNVAPEFAVPGINLVNLEDLRCWYRREKFDVTGLVEENSGLSELRHELYNKMMFRIQGRNHSAEQDAK